MTNLPAIQHARAVYQRRRRLTKEQLVEEARDLGQWGVFSKRHIASITNLPERDVARVVSKSDKTGGRFAPESLPSIEAILLGDRNPRHFKEAVACGTSLYLVSRLTGVPEATARRWAA